MPLDWALGFGLVPPRCPYARGFFGIDALSRVAGCTKLTRCGLRAVRVGEASLPGPWSHKVSSWHRHGLMVILQEVNITPTSLPSVLRTVQRLGWQMACVPNPGAAKVVWLFWFNARCWLFKSFSSPLPTRYKLLVTQLHGPQRSLRVLAAYRPPDADLSVLVQAAEASLWF